MSEEMSRHQFPFAVSLLGLGIALVSGLSSDVFHTLSKSSPVALATFFGGIVASAVAFGVGIILDWSLLGKGKPKQ